MLQEALLGMSAELAFSSSDSSILLRPVVIQRHSKDAALITQLYSPLLCTPFHSSSLSLHPPSSFDDLLVSQFPHSSPLVLVLALPTLGHLSWARRGAPRPAGLCQPLQSPLCGSQQTSVGSAKVY